MARTRQVVREFFSDPRFDTVSPVESLLYIGLGQLADRNGLLLDRPTSIAAKLPYFQRQYEDAHPEAPVGEFRRVFDGWLDALARAGLLTRYVFQRERYLQLPTFSYEQQVHPNEPAVYAISQRIHRINNLQPKKSGLFRAPQNQIPLSSCTLVRTRAVQEQKSSAALRPARPVPAASHRHLVKAAHVVLDRLPDTAADGDVREAIKRELAGKLVADSGAIAKALDAARGQRRWRQPLTHQGPGRRRPAAERPRPTPITPPPPPSTAWTTVLADLEGRVNRHTFYTWFRPTIGLADDGHRLTVHVPSSLFRDWITKHHAEVLAAALIASGRIGLTFVAPDDPPPPPPAPLPDLPLPAIPAPLATGRMMRMSSLVHAPVW
jgi:hypothetical protein